MKLAEILQIIEGKVISKNVDLSQQVQMGSGADLMSDVLAFIKPHALLLTGLTNVQTVRTADVAEIRAIVFVRGKLPDKDTIELAAEKRIVLLATRLPMFEACGELYTHGLRGGGGIGNELRDAQRTPLPSAI